MQQIGLLLQNLLLPQHASAMLSETKNQSVASS